jgi:hypothetical protein
MLKLLMADSEPRGLLDPLVTVAAPAAALACFF